MSFSEFDQNCSHRENSEPFAVCGAGFVGVARAKLGEVRGLIKKGKTTIALSITILVVFIDCAENIAS